MELCTIHRWIDTCRSQRGLFDSMELAQARPKDAASRPCIFVEPLLGAHISEIVVADAIKSKLL